MEELFLSDLKETQSKYYSSGYNHLFPRVFMLKLGNSSRSMIIFSAQNVLNQYLLELYVLMGWGGAGQGGRLFKMNAFVILYQSFSLLWIIFMAVLFRSCVLWLQFLCMCVLAYVELHDRRTSKETNIPSRIIKVPRYIRSFVSEYSARGIINELF